MLAQVDFGEAIQNAWERVLVFVPKLIAFLLILIIGYFVAKLLQKVVAKLLERVGFNRLVERGGVKQALDRTKFDASDILARLVFWIAFLFVLQLAFGVFGPNPISDLIQGLIAFLPRIFVAIVILVVAAALAKAVSELLQAALGGVPGGQVIARAAGAAIIVLAVFMALNQLQIAPAIVNGLFYALLAIIVGSAIVAVGGGGIPVMRRYWERSATKLEERAPELRQQMQGGTERARQHAQERTQQMRQETGSSAPGATRGSSPS